MRSFLEQRGNWHKVCPKCRAPIQAKDVMRIAELPRSASTLAAEEVQKKGEENDSEDIEEAELAKCGSKVRAMIAKLGEVNRENSSAKVIIFVQFSRLATIIMKSLQSNGVSVARVHGKPKL
jgi:ERCC4-related helicase